MKFHKSNYRVTLRNSDDYKLPYVKDKNTFKSDAYRFFNDLPLDLRKEINNNKFISGTKSFFIKKALEGFRSFYFFLIKIKESCVSLHTYFF